MSSAILYVAIVAIWVCVLIPRWLRRGASGAASETVPDAVPGEDAGSTADSGESGRPADAVRADAVRADAVRADAVRADAASPRGAEAGPGPSAAEAEAEQSADEAPAPLTPQESRQRMLAARRRLLGMLLALVAAALALAIFGLAALWVVIPPSVMLAGYMLLLREAAHADRERAAHAREAAQAKARERERARARARAAAAAPAAVPVVPAVPAAPPAADEETGPGRDFAPGLAGKYTTSNADVIDVSDERPGERYLRAVGD